MNDSNSELALLVNAGRDDRAPAGARARVKSAVLVRAGVTVLTASSIGTVATSSAASGLLAGGKALWIAASLFVAGGFATAVVVHERGGNATAPTVTIATRAPAPPEVATSAPFRTSEAASPVATAPTPDAPAPNGLHPSPGPARSEASASADGAAASLEREVGLLREANAALGAGNAQRALELLAQHRKQFPRGALAEERRAIMAVAECRAHPGPASSAHAQEFLRRSPNSPLIERVRAACGH